MRLLCVNQGTCVQNTLGLTRPDKRLVISVEDDGPGLPVGFDPARSHGLGMQICRIYSSEMGGDITFRASALGGAAVDVSLLIEPPAVQTEI